jgi:hypothetical protein
MVDLFTEPCYGSDLYLKLSKFLIYQNKDRDVIILNRNTWLKKIKFISIISR